MDDLLDNDSIKRKISELNSKEDAIRKESESVIAFLQKNKIDLLKLIEVNNIQRDPVSIITFINKTCLTRIIGNDDINKYINRNFKGFTIDKDHVLNIFIFSIIIAFWTILLTMFDTMLFWVEPFPKHWIFMAAFLISSIHILITISLRPKRKS